MIDSPDYNFSFSGIKTAVLYLTQRLGELDDQTKKDIALEFETAVTEVLVSKTKRAIEEFSAETVIVGGGVSANDFIKSELSKMIEENFPGTILLLPDRHLSTDNSVMIAIAGYFQIASGKSFPNISEIKADSNWSL